MVDIEISMQNTFLITITISMKSEVINVYGNNIGTTWSIVIFMIE
jgi:hypothetical protein